MQREHFDLLRELGIPLTEADLAPTVTVQTRSVSPTLPTQPHHYDDQGVAVFTAEQIAWADPSQFGFHDNYYVIEQEETSHPFALNYSDEINLVKKRPVHRYQRKERFRFVLGQIMGCSGNVPKEVLEAMPVEDLKSLPEHQLWDAVRAVLKKNRWRIYYNRIPAILAGIGFRDFAYSNTKQFQDIMHDFDLMDKIFPTIKAKLGRSYFPNLRYIAIRLMQRHGVALPCTIPLARTTRKLESLEQMYYAIWDAIEQKSVNDFIESFNF